MSSQLRSRGVARERPLLPQQYAGMPAQVWMLLVWHMLGALLVLGSLLRPADAGQFLVLRYGVLAYLVLVVGSLLVLRDSASTRLLSVLVIGNIVANSVAVATAALPLGAVTYSLTYTLIGLYAAFWNSRRFGFIVAAIISASYLGAITVSGRGEELAASWLAVSALCVAVVAVTGILVAGMQRVAVIDPLTGVMNRLGLQTLAQMFPRTGRLTLPRTLVALDLDHFTEYNDSYGRDAGDYLLRELGLTLREELRGEDIIARLDGDEFVIVLMHAGPTDAQRTIDRLRGASPAPWTAGVVDWPAEESFADALKRADVLLDDEKRKARQAPR